MKLSKKTTYLFLILFVFDFTYAAIQYYNLPLDGDMSNGIILDEHDVNDVLEDPFGIQTITNNTSHPNPNRYFCHLFFREYFLHTPIQLQKIFPPITSVFISVTLIKSVLHLGIVFLLAIIIQGFKFKINQNLLLLLLLINPMMQVKGFSNYMGIIDRSITYTFFYALPLLFLLIYLVSLQYASFHKLNKPLPFLNLLLFSSLTIILPLSGPLIPPVLLLIFVILLLMKYSNKIISNINTSTIYLMIPIAFLSIYSLYLGSYNSSYQNNIPSIWERYRLLPLGLFTIIVSKMGFILLLLLTTINTLVIKKYHYHSLGKKILTLLPWIALFTLLYIILLPLGGYRPYRPNTIRYDTFIPVTICIILLYAASTFHLLSSLQKNKTIYISVVITFCLFFSFSDLSSLTECDCQRKELRLLSKAKESPVLLDEPCNVLTWNQISDPDRSVKNAELLYYWNVTDSVILYCHSYP